MARTLRMLGRGGRLIVTPRNPASTTWLTEETSEHHGSTIQWRGRSKAASAASDIPNSQRDCKKVSKDERRAMLESYINKYREANAGKFPTASKARNEVGGCHYTVRQIIQELQYYSELDPSTSGVKTPRRKKPCKNRKSITAVEDIGTKVRDDIRSEDVAESISLMDTMTSENLRDETSTNHESVKSAAEGINPDLMEAETTFLRKDDQKIPCPPAKREDARKEAHDDQPKLMSEQNHVKEETREDGDEDESTRKHAVEVGRARMEVPKNLSDSVGPQRREKQYQASTASDRDTETLEKSSLWGNLKSFADRMLSIWRNR